jgi:hypothetical protein
LRQQANDCLNDKDRISALCTAGREQGAADVTDCQTGFSGVHSILEGAPACFYGYFIKNNDSQKVSSKRWHIVRENFVSPGQTKRAKFDQCLDVPTSGISPAESRERSR